jgi:hypothetical protein
VLEKSSAMRFHSSSAAPPYKVFKKHGLFDPFALLERVGG